MWKILAAAIFFIILRIRYQYIVRITYPTVFKILSFCFTDLFNQDCTYMYISELCIECISSILNFDYILCQIYKLLKLVVFFFCVKGAPAVQVTAPTAFNIGRFCFVLQIWDTYMIKNEKNIRCTKVFFYKMYLKGYSICSHSFSYGFQDKTFLVFQFVCRYMLDVYSITLRNFIFFFQF